MSKWLEKFKDKPLWLTLGLAGGLLIVIGVLSVVVISSRPGTEELVIQKAGEEIQTNIYVDVGGAVEKPGVYQLQSSSRVNEALVIAGGLGEEADREWVERNLNLAAKVTDGQKIYIPSLKEANKDSPRSTLQGLSLKEKININKATAAELDTLWGVGEATAKKIIDSRPYGAIEELLTKKAVKNNVYEAIKDSVSVY